MKRLVLLASLLAVAAGVPASTQTPARAERAALVPAHPAVAHARPPVSPPPFETFEAYCFECHGLDKPQAKLSIERLVKASGPSAVGEHWEEWERIAEKLESGAMPPKEATLFPTDGERAAAVGWIRTALTAYEDEHAGDPGRVTVRRLTSAEYAYAIRDLTGLDLELGIDASSDSVGGEGFANLGDVQFVHDTTVERYLEAARLVADHAVIGAGPLGFYPDPGKTGLELSALSRINDLYAKYGFRVVSGEGGRPFGLDRYGKALFVAWQYRHRAALGEPSATLRTLAAREGIAGRFAEHVWSVVNRRDARYPIKATVDGWHALPAPTNDRVAAIAAARQGCEALYRSLTTWPSWFFTRGDLAAGGAGDESPLVFDDTTLNVHSSRAYVYPLGPRAGRGRGAPPPPQTGPIAIHIQFDDVNPRPGISPVVIWRNPRVVTRAAAAPGAAPGGGRGRGNAGPVLATRPLRSLLPEEAVAALKFGSSPDGTPVGPDDFAIAGPVSFTLDPAGAGTVLELHADAELGRDRNAVVRLLLTDRAAGWTPRDATQRALMGDTGSEGYRAFRAAMADYVALLPPNSHGEANPADKDPVPAPFDNTYNSPEHDAFVLKVKYQRNDGFFTNNIVDGEDRARLEGAWTDLFGSWPYHDAYLGMLADHYGVPLGARTIRDVDAAAISALPEPMRPYVTSLRRHYDGVIDALRKAEPRHITDAIEFASRAWRRPLSDAEQSDLRAFYMKARAATGLDHDGAVRALLARILVSPAFLYRVETEAEGRQPGAPAERMLNGWEVASRLSFFLWASIPDDELRRAARAGELGTPGGIARQVERMTADPRARRLATEFFGQWLGFYHFDEYRGVDTTRFPEFTSDVRAAMYDEAISTFEYIVREGRPVKEILDADYAFLNRALAAFYGVDAEVKSDGPVERVAGARTFNRGGALRLGAVLTATSAPLRTSPVKRGDWVLRRILGTPTPPPPADAGTIPADDQTFKGMTLRQRLEQHKRNATCAACHLRIDPLGFPLETFDAVGRVRRTYADGQPVDVTGEFADETTIVGVEGLLQYLDRQDAKVMTTLSRKMIGYALGRTVMVSDRPLIREMAAAGTGASFADLAVKIATSRQFRSRRGEL